MTLDREDLLIILAGEFIALGIALIYVPVALIFLGVFIVGFRAAVALTGRT